MVLKRCFQGSFHWSMVTLQSHPSTCESNNCSYHYWMSICISNAKTGDACNLLLMWFYQSMLNSSTIIKRVAAYNFVPSLRFIMSLLKFNVNESIDIFLIRIYFGIVFNKCDALYQRSNSYWRMNSLYMCCIDWFIWIIFEKV